MKLLRIFAFQVKRFRKASCPIVERLASSLMMHGRNNGKKLMTVRIVKHTFEIIHLLTGEVRCGLGYGSCRVNEENKPSSLSFLEVTTF